MPFRSHQILTFLLTGSAAISLCWPMGSEAAAPKMRLEIVPMWQRQPLVRDEPNEPQGARVSRLDYLLSKLALKRADGSWLESRDWFVHFSLDKGKSAADADGLPSEKFTAIRFDVGVPTEINAGNPAQWAADHALNPDVCGLHWGWQGGYIFMALEGHWKTPKGEVGGFSYHLANDPNVTHVEMPIEFQGGGPITFKLALDVSAVLSGVDFEKDGTSTHSRAGDPVATKLRLNLEKAFRLVEVTHDLYQTAQPTAQARQGQGAHAYPLAVTERFPKVELPADNPLTTEGVALGEKLFHDTRLSINDSQSCASCHAVANAFSDPQRFSAGAEGQVGKRNAMALFNLAWGQGFFWDGRAKTLREQALMPIQDKHEMNETLEHVVVKLGKNRALGTDFAKAFGTPQINPECIAKALEQYLLTLISQDSRFDQAVRKVAELTEQEKQGLQLFVTEHDPKRGLFGADCFHCHGGTLFTDHQFHDNGLTSDELGRMVVTGNPADRSKFKTPSLRNIAVTAPYMHDGRFATLEEVVEHYSGPIQKRDTLDPNLAKHPEAGIQLSPADKQALIAFLKTLTDQAFISKGRPNQLAKKP
ncbi:MAG: MbnP family protein [Prosthecobacter sp.]